MKTRIEFKMCLLLCLTLFFSGCDAYSPFMRFEQRIMIQAFGIDWKDGVYTVSAQFLTGGASSSDSGGGDELNTIVGEGSNLYIAIEDAKENAGKDFFFAHNQVLVLGEGVIENNFIKTAEEYLIYCDYHPISYVTGVHGTAKDALSATYIDEYRSKHKLLLILENARDLGIYPIYTIHETFSDAYGHSGSCFIPMLRFEETKSGSDGSDKGGGEKKNMSNRTVDKIKLSNEERKTFPDDGGAFPDGGALIVDGKLLTLINDKLCQGLTFFTNINVTSFVNFHDEEGREHSLKIFKAKSKVKPKYFGEDLGFRIVHDVIIYKSNNRMLLETGAQANNKSDEALITLARGALEEKIDETAKAITSFGGDLFDLEYSLMHYDYKSWLKVEDEWREFLKNVNIEQTVDIKVV